MMNTNIEKPRLLIVDDEPDTVSTLESFFSLKGYSVLGAFDGKEALDIIAKDKIDSVLLDIKLPDIPGTEIAKIIKDKYPSIKIILLSGYLENPQDLIEQDWIEGVFIKPVKLKELNDKLKEVITPKESSVVDLRKKEGIKARVLTIKAKLLVIDQSPDIYKFLSGHFRSLAAKGEEYRLESAQNQEEISEKLNFFNPDLVLFNSATLKNYSPNLLQDLTNYASIKEIVMYNIKDLASFSAKEMQKLAKTVEASCFKNGLIEMRWINI
ncbi:MAG: response regulator [Candidatus Omnitrophota bacterium]